MIIIEGFIGFLVVCMIICGIMVATPPEKQSTIVPSYNSVEFTDSQGNAFTLKVPPGIDSDELIVLKNVALDSLAFQQDDIEDLHLFERQKSRNNQLLLAFFGTQVTLLIIVIVYRREIIRFHARNEPKVSSACTTKQLSLRS